MLPDNNAKVMATCQYACVPAAACSATVAAVIKDTTATGPTAKTRLLPSKAYKSSGATLAYKPTSGGKPASSAYAKLCGISMTVTMTAAAMSLLKLCLL